MNQEQRHRLKERMSKICPLDKEAMLQAQTRWDSIAKPLKSLGLLEEVVVRIAGMTGSAKMDLKKKCVVVMCADNGVVEEGVTQTSQEVTAVVTENLSKGMTSVCQMAKVAGATVIPVDMGVARELNGSGILSHKIAYGSKNMMKGSAMSDQQTVDAMEYGIKLVGELKEQGYRVIATGEMGIGNTSTSSAILAVLLGVDPLKVTGRGAGLSTAGLKHKIEVIRKAIAINRPNRNDPLDVLAKVGGFDLAGLVGVFLGGALFGVPIVIDGLISATAALVAVRICPRVADYLIAAHLSKEPAACLALAALGLKPFLTCELCLGEGTGAVACFPLLDMAVAVYENMSTFSEIKIKEYQPLI